GFIKKVRRDQKIDLTLQKQGYEKVKDITAIILDEIKAENGFIPLTDKSPPELIAKRFGISKKTFKKVVGALYKKKVITIEATGLRLTGD
ncbi:MAG: GntR family transcriptional regulator, partial [Nitrospirota bacterium]|nr:GntR family transcriptional regulator [Nitrospirota bacterium]